MEQKVFRANQTDDLKAFVNQFDSGKIFLVRANKSFTDSGAEGFVNQLLDEASLESFYDFDPNPQLSDLKKGINLFKKGNFDFIIAIGGGSVLDMAKLISVFAHQTGDIEDVILGKTSLNEIKTPLLAVPTTAGTGAEATQFAVLYIDKTKYSVGNSTILPEYVYLSSEFSMSASKYLTACTGLDAFCQAVESVWSVNANSESEYYALRAIEFIWYNLHDAVHQNNKNAKERMLDAAYLAGKAINITKTTAPHALSYAFTSYYNIAHGHAVALSLPYFLKYNHSLNKTDCVDPKGVESVKERIDNMLFLLNLTIDEGPSAFVEFFSSLGISTNINTLINDFKPNIIADNVNIERLSNNPRKVSKEVIFNFLAGEL